MVNKSGHWSNKIHPVIKASLELTGSKNKSANKILKYVFNIYQPKTVADFGCGLGKWLVAAKECGAELIKGYDISEVDISDRDISLEEFIEADFREEIKFHHKYDLAISLEVAEHLPADSANVFVLSLVNASDVILFAAAIPFQGGMGHVNENWIEYWAQKFACHGYECYDIIRHKFWNDPSVTYFYRQNTVLFVKDSISDKFKNQGFVPTKKPFSYIHPEMYIKAINRPLAPDKKQLYEDIRNYYKYSIGERTKPLSREQVVFYGREVLNYKEETTLSKMRKKLKAFIR